MKNGNKNQPNTLVNNNSDSALGHVEDTSSLSVVNLVGHTLLEGSISLDIDNVSALVNLVIGGKVFNSMVAESLGEHIARSAPQTLRVGHSV